MAAAPVAPIRFPGRPAFRPPERTHDPRSHPGLCGWSARSHDRRADSAGAAIDLPGAIVQPHLEDRLFAGARHPSTVPSWPCGLRGESNCGCRLADPRPRTPAWAVGGGDPLARAKLPGLLQSDRVPPRSAPARRPVRRPASTAKRWVLFARLTQCVTRACTVSALLAPTWTKPRFHKRPMPRRPDLGDRVHRPWPTVLAWRANLVRQWRPMRSVRRGTGHRPDGLELAMIAHQHQLGAGGLVIPTSAASFRLSTMPALSTTTTVLASNAPLAAGLLPPRPVPAPIPSGAQRGAWDAALFATPAPLCRTRPRRPPGSPPPPTPRGPYRAGTTCRCRVDPPRSPPRRRAHIEVARTAVVCSALIVGRSQDGIRARWPIPCAMVGMPPARRSQWRSLPTAASTCGTSGLRRVGRLRVRPRLDHAKILQAGLMSRIPPTPCIPRLSPATPRVR